MYILAIQTETPEGLVTGSSNSIQFNFIQNVFIAINLSQTLLYNHVYNNSTGYVSSL